MLDPRRGFAAQDQDWMLDERVVAYDVGDGSLLRRSRERHAPGMLRDYDLVSPRLSRRTTVMGADDVAAIKEANRLLSWWRAVISRV
jgi:hypothetical protein